MDGFGNYQSELKLGNEMIFCYVLNSSLFVLYLRTLWLEVFSSGRVHRKATHSAQASFAIIVRHSW